MKPHIPTQTGQPVVLIPHSEITHATNKPSICVVENVPPHLGIIVSKKLTETPQGVRLGNSFYARTDGKEGLFTREFPEVHLYAERGLYIAKALYQVLPVPSKNPYVALGIHPEERHQLLELLQATDTQTEGIERVIDLLAANPQTGFSARTESTRWYLPWRRRTVLQTPQGYADQQEVWEANHYKMRF